MAATWTNIDDMFLEPGKPVRSVDGLALRDNPIAIAEGAAGAPKVQNAAFNNGELGAEKFQGGTVERDWVLARTAQAAVGSVGSYAMLRKTSGTSIAAGETASGSSLNYSSAEGATGGSPSGTWRAMGRATPDGQAAASNAVTVFLRIS